MRFLWLDLRNNQGGGKCYQLTEADNTDWDVDYLGYHKNWIC